MKKIKPRLSVKPQTATLRSLKLELPKEKKEEKNTKTKARVYMPKVRLTAPIRNARKN